MEYTYLISDGRKYKIGKSINPKKRLSALLTANPGCKLICYGTGRTEKQLHDIFSGYKIVREWYHLSQWQVEMVIRLLNGKENAKDLERSATYRGRAKRAKYREAFKFNFGQYKGMNVCDCNDKNYMIWLLGRDNFKSNYPKLHKMIISRLRDMGFIIENY